MIRPGEPTLTLQATAGAIAAALDRLTGPGPEASDFAVGFADLVADLVADPADAVALALDLVARLAAHPVLPEARAAVAAGLVTLRDGDYFGPVVNLARGWCRWPNPATSSSLRHSPPDSIRRASSAASTARTSSAGSQSPSTCGLRTLSSWPRRCRDAGT